MSFDSFELSSVAEGAAGFLPLPGRCLRDWFEAMSRELNFEKVLVFEVSTHTGLKLILNSNWLL